MIDIIIAVIIDLILGDPYSFPHPVRLMGSIIRWEEGWAREYCNSKRGLKIAGLFISIINILLGFFIPYGILYLLKPYNIIYRIVKIYMIYTCIAAKSLAYEAGMVKKSLSKSLEDGRYRVGYIVGRQTDNLSEEEIIKATIETVAENTGDGIIAPLFYIFLLGAPGGFMYKFINTMDSTLGYLDDRYIDIGHFPANIDDIFNYIPARLSGILMIISSIGSRFNTRDGWEIMKRDRKNHKSPNSGYPESAAAGLLSIELGGDNYYNGILVKKPSMGDDIEKVKMSNIDDIIEIMYRSEILLIIIYILIIAFII